MNCPFLEEVIVRYCKVCSVKKLIPTSSLHSESICLIDHTQCPLFQEITQPTKNGSKECIWMKQKLISYRLCNKNFDCKNCELDQMIMDKDGRYEEHPEISAVKKFK